MKQATVAASVLLAGAIAATSSAAELRAALTFAVLVFVTSFLRVRTADSTIGFEAAVVFAATVLYHTPGIAFLAAFAGTVAHALWRLVTTRDRSVVPFSEAANLAIAYGVVALLYSIAVAREGEPAAKMAGYALLLVGYIAARLLLASMRRLLDRRDAQIDFRRLGYIEARTLVLLTPIVAAEIMLHQSWGMPGLVIGFLPVLVVAFALRGEAEAAEQNVDLVRRNRELAILTESSTEILSAETDEETLRRLAALLSKLARMKACAAVTWATTPDAPPAVYRFGECMPTDQDILRWVDAAGFAHSAPSRAFVFQSDMRRLPLAPGDAIQVLIGIQTAEIIYGILLFETEDPTILKAGSLNLLTLLVNQTALSLQDGLLRRETRSKTTQLESNAATMATILDVSNSLIGNFDIDAALTRIAEAIRTSLGFRRVIFSVRDTRRDEYVRRAHAGMDDVWEEARRKHVPASEIADFFNPEFRVSNSYFVSHRALRMSEHDFFVRADELAEPAQKHEEWHDNDMLLVPLTQGSEMIGYLSVREPQDRRVPNIEKVRTLEVFATQAVTAIQSAQQYHEIKRLTFVDAMTPAYNHRFFQEALAKEVHRHSRTGRDLALAMLDIDNFKKINDTYGHPVGDVILKGLVDELMTNARDSDVVARYGGEEFAIIFPETPGERAFDAADRLRQLVERRQFAIMELRRTLHVTISVGVAVYPHDGTTTADLISRADAALYWAKKSGKNRVVMAAEVVGGTDELSS